MVDVDFYVLFKGAQERVFQDYIMFHFASSEM